MRSGEILGVPKDKVEKSFYEALPSFVKFADEGPATARDAARPTGRPSVPPPRRSAPRDPGCARAATRAGKRKPKGKAEQLTLAKRASPSSSSRRRPPMAAKTMAARRRATPKKTERDADDPRQDREARAADVLGEATKGNNPALEIRTRALSNVSFNEKKKIIELGDRTQSREFFNTGDGAQVHADDARRERLQDAHRRGQDRQHPSDVST